MKKPLRQRSALVYVLIALIPYSRPNLLLSFKPLQFFRELEKISRYKEKTLREAYYRAERQGLIEKQNLQNEKIAQLTAKGRRKIASFTAEELTGNAKLMIIFDIPEEKSSLRKKLRKVMREWGIDQIQKSVWATDKDYREELAELINELEIGAYVELYESVRILSS